MLLTPEAVPDRVDPSLPAPFGTGWHPRDRADRWASVCLQYREHIHLHHTVSASRRSLSGLCQRPLNRLPFALDDAKIYSRSDVGG